MLRSFRLSSCILVLIFFCFDDGGVSVEGRRSYAPSHRRPRPHPRPHLYGTCVVGSINTDTGLFMRRNDDESKYIGSGITDNARECAHKCCEEKECSLSWFIAVEGDDDDEEEDNCFLVNCDSPHQCQLKDSKLKDSITHVFRKSSSPTVTTTTTTTTTRSPRIDPFLKAITNYNLGSDEMKILADSLSDLDVEEKTEIKALIDSVIAKHDEKVSDSSKTTTTTEATPIKLATNTTTAATTTTTAAATTTTTTTTTTSKTSTESPRMEKDSEKKTTMSDTEETAKAQTKEDTQSSPDKTEKSERPDWMKPKDSVDVTTGTDGSTRLSAKKHSERQLQPPRFHMGLLTAACVIGVIATVIILATMRQGVQRAWRKKDYIDADYLINGMYQPNI